MGISILPKLSTIHMLEGPRVKLCGILSFVNTSALCGMKRLCEKEGGPIEDTLSISRRSNLSLRQPEQTIST